METKTISVSNDQKTFKNNTDSSEMIFQNKNLIKILHYDARDALFLLLVCERGIIFF